MSSAYSFPSLIFCVFYSVTSPFHHLFLVFILWRHLSTTYFPCLFCDVTFPSLISRAYSMTSPFHHLFSVFLFCDVTFPWRHFSIAYFLCFYSMTSPFHHLFSVFSFCDVTFPSLIFCVFVLWRRLFCNVIFPSLIFCFFILWRHFSATYFLCFCSVT